MKNYLNLMQRVLSQGDHRKTRNSEVISIFGTTLVYDLQEGFPAVTTKELRFSSVAAELAGFLAGTTSAEVMRRLGTHIWDANARDFFNKGGSNNPDYMGPVYGAQWRNWNSEQIDQLKNVVIDLVRNPYSRRHFITAWNPSQLHEMCLPPCHTHFQFYVTQEGGLDCMFYMRSVDVFLGMPFDIASYALLTHIIANQTNYKVGKLLCVFGDTHIYKEHLEQVRTQLSRDPFPLPKLILDHNAYIDNFAPQMARLADYEHHPAIKANMTV